jgi:hypothetical protein
LLLVVGAIAALLAFAALVGGGAIVAIDQTQRDDDGFLMSPAEGFSTSTYAIASESADVDIGGAEWAVKGFLGTIRIRSESDRPVFVGIARSSAVATYLGGVRRAEVRDVSPWHVGYDVLAGGPPSAPPNAQSFWAASVTGSGEQVLDWALGRNLEVGGDERPRLPGWRSTPASAKFAT